MSTMPFTLVKTVWLHWPFNMVLIWTEVRDDPCCCPMLQPKPPGTNSCCCLMLQPKPTGSNSLEFFFLLLCARTVEPQSKQNPRTYPCAFGNVQRSIETRRRRKRSPRPRVRDGGRRRRKRRGAQRKAATQPKLQWPQRCFGSHGCYRHGPVRWQRQSSRFAIKLNRPETCTQVSRFFGGTHRLYSTGKFSKKMTLCV